MVDPNELYPVNKADFQIPMDRLKLWKAFCVVVRSQRSPRSKSLYESNFVRTDDGVVYVIGRFIIDFNELSIPNVKTLIKVVAQ